MLIKIQTAHDADSFLLIDRVDNVRYESNPREFTSQDELTNHIRLMSDIESSRIVLDPRTGGLHSELVPDPEYVGPLSRSAATG